MSKWAGVIGFSQTVNTSFDVWTEKIVEKQYYGDLTKNTRKWESSQGINDNFLIGNGVSVIADDFMLTNLKYMRYVTFQGSRWKINSIEIGYPRVNLMLGDLYNGPSPED